VFPSISESNFCFLLVLFFLIVLLFICAFKAWVISPSCPHPLLLVFKWFFFSFFLSFSFFVYVFVCVCVCEWERERERERERKWCLNSGVHACKSGFLLLKPHLQFILLWLFGDGEVLNYLPRLASNLYPPDLSLPSS
jgi:hypothetical protein